MQKFADKYVIDNPGIYNSATGCYTLCYLLMMLQTSLHNDQVAEEERMTYEQFRKYSKDIEDENMSDKMIKELFLGIKEKQLALHDLAKRIEKKKQL